MAAVQIPLDDTSPSGGGKMINANCKCHFLVEAVTVKLKESSVEVETSVLSSSDPNQVGKKYTEFFSWVGKPGMISKLLQWCCAVGIYNTKQWEADRAVKVMPSLDFTAAEGLQFCGEIKMEINKTYNDKHELVEHPTKPGPFPRLNYNIWALGDDKAADVPLSPKHVAMFKGQLLKSDGTFRVAGGGSNNDNAGGSTAKTKPSDPNPQQPAMGGAAASDDDVFG